ncbi:MAG: tyrosine-type recombinase/integrase [Magnetococcales bacterium]|nr:tyrosine-type recombinase/integrase [Magnetococcales bacterium]
MPLNDRTIRQTKPKAKTQKLFDGGGMFLEITPRGGKRWRLKFRFGGKEKLLSLGVYPDVSLKQARERREEARKLLAEGINPSEHRKATKAAKSAAEEGSFQSVALEWFAKQQTTWTPGYASRILSRLKRDVFPWMGDRPIDEVTPPELLKVLRRIESRGAVETAHRIKSLCGQVFRYAIATGHAERNPATDLRGALTPVKVTHMGTITEPKEIANLLRAMDGYEGSIVTRCALKFAALVFVRPGELRKAEWSEIDWQAAEWRIPASKMKAREQHIVPLSRQSLEVLKEIQPVTGQGPYIFPNARSAHRPMSENAVLVALRIMGYEKGQMTGHGFRAMASTRLNEMGWAPDVIERQLAHAERNAVRAAYNHAEHLPERRKMMQAWADYLDDLREGGRVIPFRQKA